MPHYKPTYKLFVRILRAQELVPLPGMSSINPYIVMQIHGSTEKIKSSIVKNTKNPIYGAEFALDGFFIGSDLLHVWVYNHSSINESNDEVIGYANVYINTFLLGEVQNYIIKLYEYDKLKKTVSQIYDLGSAGKINCQVHVSKIDEDNEDDINDLLHDKPFINNEWNYPFYNAWINIIDVQKCPAVSGDLAYPYITVSISSAANSQIYQTKIINSLNPVWNESFRILLDNYKKQVINIVLSSKKNNEVIPMGNYELSIKNHSVGHIYEDNIELTPVDGYQAY